MPRLTEQELDALEAQWRELNPRGMGRFAWRDDALSAAACNALPALLAEVREARRLLPMTLATLEAWWSDPDNPPDSHLPLVRALRAAQEGKP